MSCLSLGIRNKNDNRESCFPIEKHQRLNVHIILIVPASNLDISVIQISILSFFVVFFKDLPGGRGGRGSTFRKPRREVSVVFIYLPPQVWVQQSDRSPGYIRAFIHLQRPWLTSCLSFVSFIRPVNPEQRRCWKIRTGHQCIQHQLLSGRDPSHFLSGWVTLWREASLQRRRATWS